MSFRSPCRLASCLVLLLAGCSSSPELAIDLRSDLIAGVEIDEVLVTVDGVANAGRPLARGGDLVRGIRIYEGQLAAGRHAIEVALRNDGALVLSREYALQLDVSLIMVAVLTRDCRGVECPGSGGSAQETECLAGRCVEPGCVAVGDPECPSDLMPCTSDGACEASAACAAGSCSDGVCLEASSCPSGSYCSFETEACVPDEGVADGGPSDGGTDAPSDTPTDGGPPPLGCALRCPGGCPAIAYDVETLTNALISAPFFADVTGDGAHAILATASTREVVRWNLTAGSFVYGRSLGFTEGRSFASAAANLDDDGLADVMTVNQDCVTARANAAGWATAGSVCAPFAYGTPMAVGDLDGDGLEDDVLLTTAGGVTPLLSGADLAPLAEVPVGSVDAIGLGDLDGDGTTDAVLARTGNLLVLLGVAGGGFTIDSTIPFAGTARHVLITRMFCDTRPSVLVDAAAEAVTLFRDEDGTPTPTVLPGGTSSSGIVVADLDGDALNDVLVLEPGVGLRVLHATEFGELIDAGFIAAPTVMDGLTRSPDGHLAAVSVDGDLIVFTPR